MKDKNYYEKNARRIVTIWGPPVDDYSARIWSSLLRDYYLPRWKNYFEAKQYLLSLQDNIAKYESTFGEISISNGPKRNIPLGFGGFKGEA